MPHRQWRAVRAKGQYVVVANEELAQTDVFRLADGSRAGTCRFEQPEDSSRKISLALFDDVICGPVSAQSIAAFELATPGIDRWRADLPTPISQVFKPTENLLALADSGGRVEVIDPVNGKEIVTARADLCGDGIVDGAIVDDVLYVYGYSRRLVGGERSIGRERWAMAAIRVSNGSTIWQLGDLGPWVYLSPEIFEVSSNAIPLANVEPSGDRAVVEASGRVRRAGGQVSLIFLDKATGKPIGEPQVVTLDPDTDPGRITYLRIWPQAVQVVLGSYYLHFPVTGPEASEPGA